MTLKKALNTVYTARYWNNTIACVHRSL